MNQKPKETSFDHVCGLSGFGRDSRDVCPACAFYYYQNKGHRDEIASLMVRRDIIISRMDKDRSQKIYQAEYDEICKMINNMEGAIKVDLSTQDPICKICGKPTNRFAGDPGQWPVKIWIPWIPWIPCEPGKPWDFHQECTWVELQKVERLKKAIKAYFKLDYYPLIHHSEMCGQAESCCCGATELMAALKDLEEKQ